MGLTGAEQEVEEVLVRERKIQETRQEEKREDRKQKKKNRGGEQYSTTWKHNKRNVTGK